MTQPHMDLPPISLIKERYDGKSGRYFVKLKIRRDTRSPTLDIYEFKMSLFDSGELEEFLLFVRNFNMTLAASWTL